MEDKTFIAVVLLGFLTTASCQPPPPPTYDGLEADPIDKQLAQIGSQIFSLIRPAFSSGLSFLTSNLGTAFSNAFAATFAGKKLDLITIESLAPFKESTVSASVHSYTPGSEPPKRRPYSRAMAPRENHPETGDSS